MPASPTALGEAPAGGHLLPLTLVGRTKPDGPPALAEVPAASLAADGSVVVAEWMAREILLLDSTMVPIRTIGREGPGPGEFRGPEAVLALDSTIVTFQFDRQRTLQTFSLDGQVRTVFAPPVPGDWFRMNQRAPSLFEDVGPRGLNPVARRLLRWNSTSFVFILQDDEYSEGALFPQGVPQVKAYVLRLSFDGLVLDTLASAPAPRLAIFQRLPGWDLLGEEIYGYRPLWAFGDDWMASASVDGVTLMSKSGVRRGRVIWPEEARALTEREREGFVRIWVDLQLLYSAGAREAWQRIGRRGQRRAEQTFVSQWTFADTLPTIMDMRAAGRCLWLAGWAPDGAADGTSHRWMILDVHQPALLGVVELPGRFPRLRDVRDNRALVSTIGSAGVPELSLYRVPGLDCG